jgi:hypothetical protein
MTRPTTISRSEPIATTAIPVAGVRWLISPDALRMYAPAMLNGHAAQVSEAELIIALQQRSEPAKATLTLRYGETERAEHTLPLPAASASITRDDARSFVHIEIPGIVSMTIRCGDHSAAPTLIYAHSPLLAAIGLPGGVYDVPELLLA